MVDVASADTAEPSGKEDVRHGREEKKIRLRTPMRCMVCGQRSQWVRWWEVPLYERGPP